MADKKITLTKQGREKLMEELEDLKKNRRPQVIDRIKRAKDYGDLSENAEYEDARNEQSFIEGRVQEVEYILKFAEIITNGHRGNEISLGSKVTVDMDGDKMDFEIVGSAESDPSNGKISSEAPIGIALLGKKVGDQTVAQTPGGEMKVKVLKVS